MEHNNNTNTVREQEGTTKRVVSDSVYEARKTRAISAEPRGSSERSRNREGKEGEWG